MFEMFFTTLLVLTVLFILVSFWFKKPVVGIFAGILLMLMGIISLQGVQVQEGHTDITNYVYNATGHLISTTLTTTDDLTTTKTDVTLFLTYEILGLALLFMSIIEVYNAKKSSNVPEVEED